MQDLATIAQEMRRPVTARARNARAGGVQATLRRPQRARRQDKGFGSLVARRGTGAGRRDRAPEDSTAAKRSAFGAAEPRAPSNLQRPSVQQPDETEASPTLRSWVRVSDHAPEGLELSAARPGDDRSRLPRGHRGDGAQLAARGVYGMTCIFAFALVGVATAAQAGPGEDPRAALTRLSGPEVMVPVNLALIVSAVSTLDSTLASASRLVVVDMGQARPTLASGRIAMAACMAGGLGFRLLGTEDLYTAVAVSGTASMFLAPVIAFSVFADREVPATSYVVAFAAAMAGAIVYYLEAGGMVDLVGPLAGIEHKYSRLLAICLAVLAAGFLAFTIGSVRRKGRTDSQPAARSDAIGRQE